MVVKDLKFKNLMVTGVKYTKSARDSVKLLKKASKRVKAVYKEQYLKYIISIVSMRRKKLVAPVRIRNEKDETNNDKLIAVVMYEWMTFAKKLVMCPWIRKSGNELGNNKEIMLKSGLDIKFAWFCSVFAYCGSKWISEFLITLRIFPFFNTH